MRSKNALVGRSHRAKLGKAKLAGSRATARAPSSACPQDYRVGIVPASDTGAVEMALWSLLGARGVDVLAWESFGEGWVTDVAKQLKLKDARVLRRALWRAARSRRRSIGDHDVVFTWNGTTSGARVPERRLDQRRPRGPRDLRCDFGRLRHGSAVGQARCRHLVVAEGAGRRGGARHAGALPARGRAAGELYAALAAAEDFPPDVKGGKLNEASSQAETINTPSMLRGRGRARRARLGANRFGGLPALKARAEANLAAIARWVERTPLDRFPGRGRAIALLHLGLPRRSSTTGSSASPPMRSAAR